VSTFLYASKEDHIVPWKSAYASTQLLSNDVTFVLGASGHIAGVINPPAKNKRNYWTNDTLDAEPEGWFDGAEKVAGSWWPTWYAWLAPQAGTQVPARNKPGNATYTAIEEAPGAYVREKAS
jgi:polyhydroxyalkanoate synthase subunit PhaC